MNIIITDPDLANAIKHALDMQLEMEMDEFDSFDDSELERLITAIRALQCFDQELAIAYYSRVVEYMRDNLRQANKQLTNIEY